MSHSKVISKYLEAVRAGHTYEQAELLATSWAEACEPHPEAATKQDLRNLEVSLSANFKIVYALGAAIFTVCCLPMLQKLFGF
jgi:hypothetical protein